MRTLSDQQEEQKKAAEDIKGLGEHLADLEGKGTQGGGFIDKLRSLFGRPTAEQQRQQEITWPT